MTGLLEALERDGYQFSANNGDLEISAVNALLNPQALEQLRAHKQKLLSELHLRNFTQLVQSFGIHEHGLLFDTRTILGELDADDIECLLHTDVGERQEWAELLAHRLYRERTSTWH